MSEDVLAAVACPTDASSALFSERLMHSSGTDPGASSKCRWSSISKIVVSLGQSVSVSLWLGSLADNFLSLLLC